MTIDLSAYSETELDKLRRATSMALAPQLPFSAEGYKHHYAGIFSHQLPAFAWDWVQEFFEQYSKGVRRFGFKAHRGATKSTVWTIGFSTYVLATHPADGILIVQKNDTSGSKTSTAIANIIKSNAGWKTMYPHLVPDDKQKWAFEGYEIMDTRASYEEWRQQVLDNRPKDNSFVAYGWSNGGIVGMHPHWLFVDDVHDEENTRSKREIEAVKSTMKGNVLQTLNRPPDWDNEKAYRDPTVITSYTPWYENDFYGYMESTGIYHIMETPLIAQADEGAKGAFEWRGKYWTCAWPVKDPVKLVEQKLVEWGEMDFARMQMLDLKRAEGINLKREWLHEFPADRISPAWPVYIGVDYASSADMAKSGRDNFALAVGRVIPMGGVVLIDGYVGVLTSGDAENKVTAYASMYNPVSIGFDKTGKGEDAFHRLRSSGLAMIPCPPKGEGKRSKGERFEGQGGLGSVFQFSQAWISDISTPFVQAFREEWAAWPGGRNDDTLDAAYWMLYVAQAFLVSHAQSETFGEIEERRKSGFATMAKELMARR